MDFLLRISPPASVPRSCFHKLYKHQVEPQRDCSILPDMWQGLTKGHAHQPIAFIQDLQWFMRQAPMLVSNDHAELSNLRSQWSSIRPRTVQGVKKSLPFMSMALGSGGSHSQCHSWGIGQLCPYILHPLSRFSRMLSLCYQVCLGFLQCLLTHRTPGGFHEMILDILHLLVCCAVVAS